MWTVTEVAVWWIVGLAVWLLGLSTVTVSDTVLGALAALLGALAATVARQLVRGRWRPRARWIRQIHRVPVAVVFETATVLAAALIPGREGQERRITVPADRNRGVRDAREALATIGLSASPGTYVVDVDVDSGTLIVHAFGAETPAWARLDPSAR